MKVRVCPRCGIEVEHTCFHEGRDVPSEEMSVNRALEIVRGQIHVLEIERRELVLLQAKYLVMLAEQIQREMDNGNSGDR